MLNTFALTKNIKKSKLLISEIWYVVWEIKKNYNLIMKKTRE